MPDIVWTTKLMLKIKVSQKLLVVKVCYLWQKILTDEFEKFSSIRYIRSLANLICQTFKPGVSRPLADASLIS